MAIRGFYFCCYYRTTTQDFFPLMDTDTQVYTQKQHWKNRSQAEKTVVFLSVGFEYFAALSLTPDDPLKSECSQLTWSVARREKNPDNHSRKCLF